MTAIKTDRELTNLIVRSLGGVTAWNENGRSVEGEPIDCEACESDRDDLAEALAEVVGLSDPDVESIDWTNTCTKGFNFDEPYWAYIEKHARFAEAQAAFASLTETGWTPIDAQC